jgi:hypothetical protein
MLRSEIEVGQEYVLREGKSSDTPIQRVKIIQHIRRKKWKAEWINPNPGLVEYVDTRHILVLWKERKAFFRDEEKARELRDENERHGYNEKSPIANVLYEVFDSAGESELHFYRGEISGSPEALDRLRDRAGFDRNKISPITYIDRHGTFHSPYSEAIELAKAFCISEPNTVLLNIESTERKWIQEASQPGEEHILPLLNEYRAAWAIIRQWTGFDAAFAQKEAQIQRLERLVLDAIYTLQKAGLDNAAHRLRRALQKD